MAFYCIFAVAGQMLLSKALFFTVEKFSEDLREW